MFAWQEPDESVDEVRARTIVDFLLLSFPFQFVTSCGSTCVIHLSLKANVKKVQSAFGEQSRMKLTKFLP